VRFDETLSCFWFYCKNTRDICFLLYLILYRRLHHLVHKLCIFRSSVIIILLLCLRLLYCFVYWIEMSLMKQNISCSCSDKNITRHQKLLDTNEHFVLGVKSNLWTLILFNECFIKTHLDSVVFNHYSVVFKRFDKEAKESSFAYKNVRGCLPVIDCQLHW